MADAEEVKCFDRVTEGMTEVEYPPAIPLTEIISDYIGFRSGRQSHELSEELHFPGSEISCFAFYQFGKTRRSDEACLVCLDKSFTYLFTLKRGQ